MRIRAVGWGLVVVVGLLVSAPAGAAIVYRFEGLIAGCAGCGFSPIGGIVEGIFIFADGTDTSAAVVFDETDVEGYDIVFPTHTLGLRSSAPALTGTFGDGVIESLSFTNQLFEARFFEVNVDGSWLFYQIAPRAGLSLGCAPPPLASRFPVSLFCAFDASGTEFTFARVPEPSMLGLILLGLVGLAVGLRRQRVRRIR